MSEEQLLEKLTTCIVEGDEDGAAVHAKLLLAKGLDPLRATELALVKGMQTVADRWDRGEVYLSDAMLAAGAMRAAMSVFLQGVKFEERMETSIGKIVLGTVFGDLHDIGKDIVGAMLTAHSFMVFDIGVDALPSKFIEKADEVKADIIAMSCLISPSLLYQRELLRELDSAGKRRQYYVVVGGAAVDSNWARKIHADGYARNAKDAPTLCKKLLERASIPPLQEPLCLD